MTKLFVVHHIRKVNDEHDDYKMIGIYSSYEGATKAIAKLQQMLGFREYPNDFSIDEYILDKDYWEEGFVTE